MSKGPQLPVSNKFPNVSKPVQSVEELVTKQPNGPVAEVSHLDSISSVR